MKTQKIGFLLLTVLAFASAGFGATQVPMTLVSADGTRGSAGHINISESEYGLVFTPSLTGLSPGNHGFHVHQNPSCAPAVRDGRQVAGLSAGGHFDPHNTNRHGTPWGDGHLGDLPALYVDGSGRATLPVLAPRLTLQAIKGRALMVHAGGDNYSDQPKKLGGGGARMACGVID